MSDSINWEIHSSFVNDTPQHRFLVLAAIRLLKRVQPHAGRRSSLSLAICVSTIHPFLCPGLLRLRTSRLGLYIFMERIHGDMIAVRWVYRSEELKMKLLLQLRQFIQEIMGLVPPAGCGIANIDGGALYDCRLPGPSLRFEPFSNIQDFHYHLREGLQRHPDLDRG
ncbi:hypothetical protein GB937_008396 [Aspergillus fischeri]|nr:hypothetical protein GB937_008396 [Aspergillus fischeri]